MEYRATHNLPRLEAALKQYPVEKMAAAVRALNRTAASVRAESARRLQPDLGGIKIGTIKAQLKITQARVRTPTAILDYSGKRFGLYRNLNLTQFATKWGTGVRLKKMPYRLELADGTPITPEQLGRLFLQRSRRTGKPTVWVRLGSKSIPFEAVVVSSVSTVYRARGLAAAMLALGRERMATILEHEFRYRLSQRIL